MPSGVLAICAVGVPSLQENRTGRSSYPNTSFAPTVVMVMRMGAPIFRFTRVAPPWPKCTQSSGPAVVRLVSAWAGAWLTIT